MRQQMPREVDFTAMLQPQRALGKHERNLQGDSVKPGVGVAEFGAVGQSIYAERGIQRRRADSALNSLVHADAVVVEDRQAYDCERRQRRQAVVTPREF